MIPRALDAPSDGATVRQAAHGAVVREVATRGERRQVVGLRLAANQTQIATGAQRVRDPLLVPFAEHPGELRLLNSPKIIWGVGLASLHAYPCLPQPLVALVIAGEELEALDKRRE